MTSILQYTERQIFIQFGDLETDQLPKDSGWLTIKKHLIWKNATAKHTPEQLKIAKVWYPC